MNKHELDKALEFIIRPQGELQIIFYATLEGGGMPRKLDIKNDDLPSLKDLFIKEIQSSIISKEDYSILPLSSADERGKCFYQYDLELPPDLKNLEDVIGNDGLLKFNFISNDLSTIESIIVVIADESIEISLLKKLTPVEIIGRGGYILWKSNERFERFNDQMLRISSKFQVLRVDNELIIIDLNSIEKSFGFHDVIIREATLSLSVIKDLDIVSNMDSLEILVGNISFARKLTRVAKSSPVIKLRIPNEKIIAFAMSHPLTKKKMKYSEDGTQFYLHTKVSKDLFIKILNDDLLTSELTELYYDSLAKDDIVIEIETQSESNDAE